ncbi:MAG: GNAT family N-acetyltransferase [Chloroflexota bacterium]
MLHLRQYAERDQSAVRAIRSAVYPEYDHEPTGWLAANQLDAPPNPTCRYVVDDPITHLAIGYAGLWPWSADLGKYRLDLIVHPRWQRQGVGGMLLTRCLRDLGDLHAQTVQARVRDDHAEARDFLIRRGFVATQQMDGLTLEVRLFDPSLARDSAQHLAIQGITVQTLAEIKADNDASFRELCSLHNAVLPDWPDPDPPSLASVSFDAFVRQLVALRVGLTDVVVAVERGRFVGYCILSFGTAVHPNYRGRGVATALKARAVVDARERGIETLFTCTANPAMRRINEKMGYRHVRSEIRLVRPIPVEDWTIRRRCHSERERGISGPARRKPETPRRGSG